MNPNKCVQWRALGFAGEVTPTYRADLACAGAARGGVLFLKRMLRAENANGGVVTPCGGKLS